MGVVEPDSGREGGTNCGEVENGAKVDTDDPRTDGFEELPDESCEDDWGKTGDEDEVEEVGIEGDRNPG